MGFFATDWAFENILSEVVNESARRIRVFDYSAASQMGARCTQVRQAIGILYNLEDKRIVNNNINASCEAGCITSRLTYTAYLPISGIAEFSKCKAIAIQQHGEIT